MRPCLWPGCPFPAVLDGRCVNHLVLRGGRIEPECDTLPVAKPKRQRVKAASDEPAKPKTEGPTAKYIPEGGPGE